jgi:hypothetical protein
LELHPRVDDAEGVREILGSLPVDQVVNGYQERARRKQRGGVMGEMEHLRLKLPSCPREFKELPDTIAWGFTADPTPGGGSRYRVVEPIGCQEKERDVGCRCR